MILHAARSSLYLAVALLASVSFSACSTPSGSDAGGDTARDIASDLPADAVGTCATDNECSDNVYCNGAERCTPGAASGDSRGCVAAASTPCSTGQTCDEAMRRCVASCADEDTDGHRAQSCGGDDCDDHDANRYPGNAEVCDTADHDEDCDAVTFGVRDGDGDGAADRRCCNRDSAGSTHCGSDCDDTNAMVHPGAMEVCDALAVDEDCDGTANPAALCSCSGTASRSCEGALGACASGTQTCVMGSWSACSITPTTETCNGADDDCDGMTDEGTTVTCFADGDSDTYAPVGTAATAQCPDPARAPVGQCPAGYTNRDPSTAADCNDTQSVQRPDATETCDGLDNNCNGTVDEGVGSTYWRDRDADGFGDSTMVMTACSLPTGYVPASAANSDCNDTNSTIRGPTVQYVDGDRDGYGTGTAVMQCPGTAGYSPTPGDCLDDTSTDAPNVHPGQAQYFPRRWQNRCTGLPCTTMSSWDWNCDGSDTPAAPISAFSTCTGTCLPMSTGPCPGSGFSYTGTPVCGSAQNYRDCGTGCACVSGAGTTTSQPLPCH